MTLHAARRDSTLAFDRRFAIELGETRTIDAGDDHVGPRCAQHDHGRRIAGDGFLAGDGGLNHAADLEREEKYGASHAVAA
jgi:hypothetical protein